MMLPEYRDIPKSEAPPMRAVMVDDRYADHPSRVPGDYPIAVVFKRADGWSLGSRAQYRHAAYEQWDDHWTMFWTAKDGWRPIQEYTR